MKKVGATVTLLERGLSSADFGPRDEASKALQGARAVQTPFRNGANNLLTPHCLVLPLDQWLR